MAHADWIIDLGPGAGHEGGRIVFEGTPTDLVADRSTLTGQHLAAYVGASGPGKAAKRTPSSSPSEKASPQRSASAPSHPRRAKAH
jgi:excinuclease UvrABC ATPase subunit